MEFPCKRFSSGHYLGRISVVFALLCVAALQPAFGQSFTIKDLGTLPGGDLSTARGINDRGQVVGDSETKGFSQPHAFLFEDGVMVDLGTLPGAGALFSEAFGINNRGQVAGFSGSPVLFEYAVLFENGVNGVIVNLGTLGSNNGSGALGINNRGQVVGEAGTASGAIHAFLFDNGAMVDLGTLPGGSFSIANGINDRGQVVGSSTANGLSGRRAFLFEDGVMVDLGALPGGDSEALGINNQGQVVGDSSPAALQFPHAVLWTPTDGQCNDDGIDGQSNDDGRDGHCRD